MKMDDSIRHGLDNEKTEGLRTQQAIAEVVYSLKVWMRKFHIVIVFTKIIKIILILLKCYLLFPLIV